MDRLVVRVAAVIGWTGWIGVSDVDMCIRLLQAFSVQLAACRDATMFGF